jgi:hypothetical protein
VACHEWLASQSLEFRATKDMDIVLVVEALDETFVKRFWEFIEAGNIKRAKRLLESGNSIGSINRGMKRIRSCSNYSADAFGNRTWDSTADRAGEVR